MQRWVACTTHYTIASFVQKMSVCKDETVLCSAALPAPNTKLALCRRCQCVKIRQCYVALGCLHHTLY